jgi:hypothetical protein
MFTKVSRAKPLSIRQLGVLKVSNWIIERKIMFRYLQASALMGAGLMLGLVPSLKASDLDKKTIITINERVAVEDVVLPPGEYVLRLLGSPSDRQIVEIFNQDETHLIGAMMAIPAYRLTPGAGTRVTLYEAPAGQLPALRSWFYSDDSYGIEFLSPRGAAVKSNSD